MPRRGRNGLTRCAADAMSAIGVSHVLIVARLTRGRVRSAKREEHS